MKTDTKAKIGMALCVASMAFGVSGLAPEMLSCFAVGIVLTAEANSPDGRWGVW